MQVGVNLNVVTVQLSKRRCSVISGCCLLIHFVLLCSGRQPVTSTNSKDVQGRQPVTCSSAGARTGVANIMKHLRAPNVSLQRLLCQIGSRREAEVAQPIPSLENL